ncbi:unnamed protein product, partial [Mesorhabditis spiculigera]
MRRLLFFGLHFVVAVATVTTPATVDSTVTTLSTARLWDVIIKTCDAIGSGTDAAAYLKLYYEQHHDGETFQLDNPGRNDFERGARDHFKLRFRQRDVINIGLFWWPGFSLSQQWCVDWVLLLNSDTETCFEAIFEKWIHHYRDPPTYASGFAKLPFSECVGPGRENATRMHYKRFDEEDRLRSS